MSKSSIVIDLDLSKAEGNILLNPEFLERVLLHPDHLARLPSKEKYIKLLDSIAKYYNASSQNIVLGNGSDELIEHIAYAKRGGVSLTLVPTFERLYEVNTKYNYEVHVYELPGKNEYKYSSKIHKDFINNVRLILPDIIWLCSPCNPTGTIIAPSYLAELALEFTNSWIVLDMAFIDITNIDIGLKYINLAQKHSNVLVLNSFSKSWGIAALRVGFLCTNLNIAKEIAHQNVMFNINGIAVELAQKCLDNDGYRKKEFIRLHNHLEIIRKAIADMPSYEIIVNSNINIFCLRHHNIPDIHKILLDKGVKTKSLDHMPGMLNSGFCRILVPRDLKDVHLLLQVLASIS